MTSCGYICTHYTAVWCYNAPINFPFDILRAIYKSHRPSRVPLLMPSKTVARQAVFGDPPNKPVSQLCPTGCAPRVDQAAKKLHFSNPKNEVACEVSQGLQKRISNKSTIL